MSLVDTAELSLKRDQRASRIRRAILLDEEFMRGVQEGYEEAQRGEVLTLAELDQQLGLD